MYVGVYCIEFLLFQHGQRQCMTVMIKNKKKTNKQTEFDLLDLCFNEHKNFKT